MDQSGPVWTSPMPFWLILVVIGLLGGFGGRALWSRWRHRDRSVAHLIGPALPSTKRQGQAWRFCYPPLVWQPPSSITVTATSMSAPPSSSATMMMIGAWAGGDVANRIRGPHLRAAPEAGLRGFRVRHRVPSISSMEHASDSDGCRRSRLHRRGRSGNARPGQERQKVRDILLR